jgi:hypothetical protein
MYGEMRFDMTDIEKVLGEALDKALADRYIHQPDTDSYVPLADHAEDIKADILAHPSMQAIARDAAVGRAVLALPGGWTIEAVDGGLWHVCDGMEHEYGKSRCATADTPQAAIAAVLGDDDD